MLKGRTDREEQQLFSGKWRRRLGACCRGFSWMITAWKYEPISTQGASSGMEGIKVLISGANRDINSENS
jgi:hypothetical protein